MRHVIAAFVAPIFLCLVSCADRQTPESQVRATIEAIERAAEARDVGDVMAHVSPQFRDAYGRDGNELSKYVRGYFIANQSIHLLTRIESIEFPTQDEASAKVTVGMVGREADAANAWNLAGEIRDFEVTFFREGGEWRVSYVKWGADGVPR